MTADPAAELSSIIDLIRYGASRFNAAGLTFGQQQHDGPPLSVTRGMELGIQAAFGAAEAFKGDKVALQYTTTSPRLHQLLGVAQATAA